MLTIVSYTPTAPPPSLVFLEKVKDSELDKPAKVTTKKGEKDGEGSSKLYGDWQTESWTPEAAVDGKVCTCHACMRWRCCAGDGLLRERQACC